MTNYPIKLLHDKGISRPEPPRLALIVTLVLSLLTACNDDNDDKDFPVLANWSTTKANAAPDLFLQDEFEPPYRLEIATLGWEDGLNISRDGLHIYATYIPADFLSFVLNGDSVENLQNYDRGPHYDINFSGNPTGETYPWYHSDIIYSTRASTEENFAPWQTSRMKRAVTSEGAPSTVFSGDDSIDILAFTSNEEYTANTNIRLLRDVAANPSGLGTPITSTDDSGTSTINTLYIEDNPHIERIDPGSLVLFFDSPDRPGSFGDHDIWYAQSADNGETWSTPLNVTSVNTTDKEHQPHLYYDGSQWWLYFSAYHTDNKLAIFRSQQLVEGNWNNWGPREIVMGAGNTVGIGEPTLTDNGDMCFVVIYENSFPTRYNRYDADPWCSPAR